MSDTDRMLRGAWWKGSLPSWMVAGLLGIVIFFLHRYVDEIDARVRESDTKIVELYKANAAHAIRLGVTETQVQNLSSTLTEIRTSQGDLRNDIRDLRHDLKK